MELSFNTLYREIYYKTEVKESEANKYKKRLYYKGVLNS